MKELVTIQTENKLNDVFAVGNIGAGGAKHHYIVVPHGSITEQTNQDALFRGDICAFAGEVFFNGPRNEPDSTFGVLDCDLLEIVRDRLTDFMNGPYPSKDTEDALYHVSQALLSLSRRTQDRAERGVLGENKV